MSQSCKPMCGPSGPNVGPESPLSAGGRGASGRWLEAEYVVLVRRMARLQCLFDELLSDHDRKVSELEAEIVRLRGRLVMARTQTLWGFGAVAALPERVPLLSRAPLPLPWASMPHAAQVLCQVACVGHAHYWLQEGGDCARSGERCEGAVGDGIVGGTPSKA